MLMTFLCSLLNPKYYLITHYQLIVERDNGAFVRAHRPYQLLSALIMAPCTNTGRWMKGSCPSVAGLCPFVLRLYQFRLASSRLFMWYEITRNLCLTWTMLVLPTRLAKASQCLMIINILNSNVGYVFQKSNYLLNKNIQFDALGAALIVIY